MLESPKRRLKLLEGGLAGFPEALQLRLSWLLLVLVLSRARVLLLRQCSRALQSLKC
jgi:hypothetical protein